VSLVDRAGILIISLIPLCAESAMSARDGRCSVGADAARRCSRFLPCPLGHRLEVSCTRKGCRVSLLRTVIEACACADLISRDKTWETTRSFT